MLVDATEWKAWTQCWWSQLHLEGFAKRLTSESTLGAVCIWAAKPGTVGSTRRTACWYVGPWAPGLVGQLSKKQVHASAFVNANSLTLLRF
jgi:hypothetical protein